MKRLTNLILPEFSFLDAHVNDVDELHGRNVILHIRSMSIIEVFDRESVFPNENVISYKFSYTNKYGIKEPMIALLHLSMTLDANVDIEIIKEQIMKPAAQWYCNYCTWEDGKE